MAPAARYLAPEPHQAMAAVASLRREPSHGAEQMDQLLFGERFDVLEARDGWAFGQALRDGYVGWLATGSLGEVGPAPTHRVSALRTFAFAEPSIKAPPRHCLSMNALATESGRDGRFIRLAGSGWVVADHLASLGVWEADPAAVAERYLGAPYLWGGRDSLGIDCSGLVQQALYACGRACPRDSDLQAQMGRPTSREHVGRGDLVFWRGHVGILLDAQRLLHANAFHMQVAIEPLDATITRIQASGGGAPTAIRRL